MQALSSFAAVLCITFPLTSLHLATIGTTKPVGRAFLQCMNDSCPTFVEELVFDLPEVDADSLNAGLCSLLCLQTQGCQAFCLESSMPSARHNCRLFGVRTFVSESATGVVIRMTDFGRCFIRYPELIPLRNCSQSSVEYGGYCEYGIDENFTQNYYQHPCTHTAFETNRWWRVSFAWRAVVTSVTIFNRLDESPGRLDNFSISVDGQKCADFALNGTAAFSVRSFACHRAGSSLEISSPQIGILSLCEVQAFGFAIDEF